MSGDSTRCVKAVAAENVPGSPMQRGPVFAAPYQLSADEGTESDTYARASNPGWRDLESALATLEGAAGALVVGSGMSAVTVVLRSLLTAGDTVVVPSDGYYQVRAYARERLEPMGITVHELRTADMAGEAAAALLASAEGTTVVVAETPANPSLDVVDLRAVSEQCANAGAVLVVDNTTATPLGQQPLELGADVVVASGTKTLSGHSDLLMGTSPRRTPTSWPEWNARGRCRARCWGRSRRGSPTGVSGRPVCDSSGSAPTPWPSRPCSSRTRRLTVFGTRGCPKILRTPSPPVRCVDSAGW